MENTDLECRTEKVCAVVVTYNRKELLAVCLAELLNQTRQVDEIIVMDNASTDGTEHVIKERFRNITYVRLPENIGGAGGFHEGMKLAYQKGYDWVWIMDEDAKPLPDALEKLLKAKERLPAGKIGALACNVVPSDEEAGYNSSEMITQVELGMFVGFLVSRRALEDVGLPRKDFFIYWDDLEYCRRLASSGLSLYKVSNSYIVHKDWRAQPKRSIRILFHKEYRPIYADWKEYYLFRNRILMLKSQRRNYELLKTFLWLIPVEILVRLLMGDAGKVKFILKATVDGLTNKTGKRVLPGDR